MGLGSKGFAKRTRSMDPRMVLAIFGLGSILISACSSPTSFDLESKTGFSQVRAGLAVDEVEEILGPPDHIKTLQDGKDYQEWNLREENGTPWRLFIIAANDKVVDRGASQVSIIEKRTSLDQVMAGMSPKEVEKIMGPGKREEVQGRQQLSWNRRADGQDWQVWVSFQDGKAQNKGTIRK